MSEVFAPHEFAWDVVGILKPQYLFKTKLRASGFRFIVSSSGRKAIS